MAHAPIRRLPQPSVEERPRVRTSPPTLLQLLRLRANAWKAERATDAELRILACHTRLVEARSTLAVAQLTSRRAEASVAIAAEAEERELAFLRLVRASQTDPARQIIGADTEVERLLLERERLRRERASPGRLPPPPSALPPAPSPQADTYTLPALTVAVSNQQVKQLAARAFARFAQLPPAKAERAWEAWEQEVRQRLPRLTAEDVIAQAAELRRLV